MFPWLAGTPLPVVVTKVTCALLLVASLG